MSDSRPTECPPKLSTDRIDWVRSDGVTTLDSSDHTWSNSEQISGIRSINLSTMEVKKSFWLLTILLLICSPLTDCCDSQRCEREVAPCYKYDCAKAAVDILRTMDSNVDPCENFYDYACNGWAKRNPLPEGRYYLEKGEESRKTFVKKFLENQSLPHPSRGTQLAQTFYKSCINQSWINHLGFEPLYAKLKDRYGGWVLLPEGHQGARSDNGWSLQPHHFDLTEQYLTELRFVGSTHLFRIDVLPNRQDDSRFVITLGPGHLLRPREIYLDPTNPENIKSTKSYESFVQNYSLLLGVPRYSLKELDAIFGFEKTIAYIEAGIEPSINYDQRYEVTTVRELNRICPVIKWNSLLNTLFTEIDYPVGWDEPVTLNDPIAFRKRCKLYQQYLASSAGIRILHNTAVWYFIMGSASYMPPFVSKLWKQSVKEFKDFEQLLLIPDVRMHASKDAIEYSKNLKSDSERKNRCVMETAFLFSPVVDRHFVREKFNEGMKSEAAGMFEEIRKTTKAAILTADWMNNEEKVRALMKIDQVKVTIGFLANLYDSEAENRIYAFIRQFSEFTYLENMLQYSHALVMNTLYTIKSKKNYGWDMPARDANAVYMIPTNHVYIPAGRLQPPVYHVDYPIALNYGSVGYAMAHEIMHALDKSIDIINSPADLILWLTDKSKGALGKKKLCMINQYSNYSFMNVSLSGLMTLNENLADNGGIKIAYQTFKRAQDKYQHDNVLPGVDLTSDQLFFLSFAQTYCINYSPDDINKTISTMVHTVEPYRIIGALSNSEEFSRAFSCRLGSRMNPRKKCQIW